MRRLMVLSAVVCIGSCAVSAQDRAYGRSMVITDHGIVATSQVLASQAGAQILAQGRFRHGRGDRCQCRARRYRAHDERNWAAILFLLYWDAKTGKLYGLNASGWAPRNLTIDFLKKKGITTMPQDGIHSVTVPGAVDGWGKAHERFGRLPWKDLFTPAIYYAEHGFPVPEIIHDFWGSGQRRPATEPRRRSAYFFRSGKVPEVGEMFSNPDLGKTLRLIAEKGPQVFYRGEIAQAILKTSIRSGRHHGGRRSGGFLLGMGGTNFHRLPRLEGLRTAAQWAGDGCAGDVEHHGARRNPTKTDLRVSVELHKKIEAMKLAYTDLVPL